MCKERLKAELRQRKKENVPNRRLPSNMLLALYLCPRPSEVGRASNVTPVFVAVFGTRFGGHVFRPNFTARGSHTKNLGSSLRPQLQCAGSTPQTSGPPRDLRGSDTINLESSITVRGSDTINLGSFITVRESDTTNLGSSSGSSIRVRGSDAPFGFYHFFLQRQANPIYAFDR